MWKGGLQGFARGHEFSGVVVDPGKATNLKAGDRVTAMEINPCGECEFCRAGRPGLCPKVFADSPGFYANGGMADYVLVRPDMVRKLPDNVDYISGAMIEPAAVAMHAVQRSGVTTPTKVFVRGAGPIGMFTAACAKALGAAFTAIVEINPDRLALAKSFGCADAVLDAAAPDLKEQVLALTSGAGFDILADASGAVTTDETLALLKTGGTYVEIGMHGEMTISKRTLGLKEYRIMGSILFSPPDFDLVIELMGAGKLNISKMATRITDFSEAQACFEELAFGRSKNMKILFKVDEEKS
jgi:2-desacetyl-2-hydroxyethyl bacteriochlorophyllide A dehydrogenase